MDLLHVVNPEDSCEQFYFSIQVHKSDIWVTNFLIIYHENDLFLIVFKWQVDKTHTVYLQSLNR